jgi:pantoate--beta-alanine ligase
MAPRPRKTTVIKTLTGLRGALARFRARRESVALVPTMGALHAGHLQLVRLAARKADRVVVSIFVNPAQFGPTEDFATYPRTLKSDLALLEKLAVDLVWVPNAHAMYPPGFATEVGPRGPAAAGLEDTYRPHFFTGVATVVTKLLLQVAPDCALFGEKDYQQLKVVTQMAKDLDIPVRIIGAPTLREPDGLALSSRNAYLSPQQRQIAPKLYEVLSRSVQQIAQKGKSVSEILEAGRAEIADAGFALDYLEARHADTLAPLATLKEGPIRLLVAARIGKTRLIDNVAVPAGLTQSRPSARNSRRSGSGIAAAPGAARSRSRGASPSSR